MVSNRGKMQRNIAKERAQAGHAADREKDTIYWLVFEPRTDVPVPPKGEDFWTDPWRVRLLPRNPQGSAELVEYAIGVFERKFNLKSWEEIAVRYHPDSLYYP